MGLVVGFVGIVILVGFDPVVLSATGLVPVAALLGSTVLYASGAVYARRFLAGVRPMALALGEVGIVLVNLRRRTAVSPAGADGAPI